MPLTATLKQHASSVKFLKLVLHKQWLSGFQNTASAEFEPSEAFAASHSKILLLQTFSEEGFYAWTYDRPASPYLWIGSVLIAVIVLAACLFPLAPYKVKLVVVYLSMGVLMVLMGSLLLRGAVAGATWMAIGRSFWLLPNVLSEVRRQCCCCAMSTCQLLLACRNKQAAPLFGRGMGSLCSCPVS